MYAWKQWMLTTTLNLKCSTWMCYLLSTKRKHRRPSVFSVPFLCPIETVIDIWSSRVSRVSRNSGRWTTCLGSLFLPRTIRTVLFSLALKESKTVCTQGNGIDPRCGVGARGETQIIIKWKRVVWSLEGDIAFLSSRGTGTFPLVSMWKWMN